MSDIQKYIKCMEEVKRRTTVIFSFLRQERTTGYKITDAEFVCLQFRKIFELIALASLTANREEYERHRKNFASHWHANKILKDIEKVNPYFYPVPTQQIIEPETGKVIETRNIIEGYLTRDEFEAAYDLCSELLHSDNPYGRVTDVDNIISNFSDWITKIITLLNHHQIQLIDTNKQLWVIIEANTDSQVHVYEMVKQ